MRLARLGLLVGALAVLFGCNADPKKMARSKRRRPAPVKKNKLNTITQKRVKLFGPLGGRVRVLIAPADVASVSLKRNKVGVLFLKYDHALRSVKLLEYVTKSTKKGCSVEWLLHVWDNDTYRLGEIMWGCKLMRVGDQIYDLAGTPRKVIATMITKSRLHPNFWLSLLKVPVVHNPSMVSEAIKEFVEEIVPHEYGAERYPSFTVATQHTTALPSNFSHLDSRVKALRERLMNRLRTFAVKVKKRGKGTVYKVLKPHPIKERFTRELFAEWGVTVLCSLGTNSDKMYWLGNWPRLGVVKINIPTHYIMVVVKKNDTQGPSLFARISGLELDPPIEFYGY